jgi:histidinol-phosphate aminotransferase
MKFSFNPYNVNRLSIIAGSEAIKDKDYFLDCTKKIIEVREIVKNRLKQLGFALTDSMANFILAKHPDISGKELYLSLKEKGILVRYLGGDISDYVRITIGSAEQMEVLVCTIEKIINKD